MAELFKIYSVSSVSRNSAGITQVAEAMVSIRRLQKFMMYDEVEPNSNEIEEVTENSMMKNNKENIQNNKENFKQNAKKNAEENTKEENPIEEKKTNQVNMEQPDSIEYRISIENANAKWLEDEKEETLQNINIKVRPGELIAIVGQVGAGKSSLLNVILKELRLQEGSIQVCSQSSTIKYQSK